MHTLIEIFVCFLINNNATVYIYYNVKKQ